MRVHKGKRVLCLLAAGLLSLGTVGRTEIRAAKAEAPDGMKLAASNEFLELYVDEDTTDFAVRDVKSGEIWYSAPDDPDGTGASSPYLRNLTKAHVTVQYYNESVQVSNMDSSNDSVSEDQFEIEYTDDGMTITFTLGNAGNSLLLPTAISEERMLAFQEQMDSGLVRRLERNYTLLSLEGMKDSDRETNLALYPGLETHNVYVLRGNVKDYMKEELAEYFASAGYTQEDYEIDLEELGETEEVSTPWFIIPVSYRLEEDSLVVSVDPSAIEYNDEEYYLTTVGILPYFGSADLEDEGYMFVPDGSGALIYLNNGKTAFSAYGAMVYGQDRTMQVLSERKSEIDENLTVKLPVYGMKTEGKAWFAIIEDGDSYAEIDADISGRTTNYNHVYSRFTFLESGGISLGDMVGSNSLQLYSQPKFDSSYTVRFSFCAGDDADYSWMASRYQEYLEQNGVLTRLEDGESVPFYAEYIGAIDKYETILGVRYRAVTPLTTYAQAKEITSMLKDRDVEDLTVVYTGWYNGGLAHTAATKITPVKKLDKGGVSLKEFNTDMASQGIPVYMTVDYQNAYKDKLLDGYSAMSDGPRYFDHTVVKGATYLTANGRIADKNIFMISPYKVESVVENSVKALLSSEIRGVNVDGLSSMIYTDMLEEHYIDSQDAMNANSRSIAHLDEQMEGGVMGSNSNAYAFPWLKDIINTPMSSNNYFIIDEEVPFYQMVLHGYMNYAGEAINLSDDYRTSVLKCLESGAGLYFQWIYEDNSVLKETDFDYLYSVCYEAWLEQAAESYQEIKGVLGGLQNQKIVKHEKIEDNVVGVTYEDGTRILINYGDEKVTVGKTTVESLGYAVEKGGR